MNEQRTIQGMTPLLKEGPSRLYNAIRWICVMNLGLQVIVVVYVVFGRFILNNTPKWGEEIALLAMVWLSLLSAALAMEDDTHIRMSVFDRFFSYRGLIVRDIIFFVLNVTFCIFLVIEGIKLSILTRVSIMPGSKLPVPILYVSVPIAGAGYVFIIILKFIEQVKSWIKIQSQ